MIAIEKINEFNYIVKNLIIWFCDVKGFSVNEKLRIEQFNNDNDFSITKVRMLLFFLVTAKGEESEFLNGNFNEFYALPFGPYESEIYNHIKTNNLNIELGKFLRDSFILDKLEIGDTVYDDTNIKSSINVLKDVAPHIIEAKGFDLVNMSKLRLSYSSAFSQAEKLDKFSWLMSNYLMKKEKKYYGYKTNGK